MNLLGRITTVAAAIAAALALAARAEPLSPPLSGAGADIMKSNPFLAHGVGKMPPVREDLMAASQSNRRPGDAWVAPVFAVSLDPCSKGIRAHLGAPPDEHPTCMHVKSYSGPNPADPNHPKVKTFEAAFYKGTHQIERIYETGVDPKLVRKSDADGNASAIRLVATVSVAGAATETPKLLKVSADGNKVEEVAPPVSAAKPGESAAPASAPAAAVDCNAISNVIERAKCLAKGAIKK